MSHMITSTDGAVFHKVPAWHGLGYTVEQAMTPSEAMDLAGLGWVVVKSDGISANGITDKEYSAIIRTDTSTILSVQSSGYAVVQNSEVFDLAWALGNEVKVESALSMSGGRKVVVLLRGDTFHPDNSHNDEVAQYLALINSHDGTMALSALPTSVRIVCNNTLSMALSAEKRLKKGMFRVTHTGDMQAKQQAMRDALGRFRKTGALFVEAVNSLSRREMTVVEIQNFWLRVWGALEAPVVASPANAKEEANNLAAVGEIAKWSMAFDAERARLGAPASLWMAANAVTRSVQHTRNSGRGRKPTYESKGWAAINGVTQDETLVVMNEALAFA